MAVVADTVVVELEARLQKYVANLVDAERKFDQTTNRISRKSVDLSRAGRSAAQSFGRQLSTLLPSLAAGAVASAIRSMVAEASDLKDFADRVGIATDQLQALQYAAKLSGSSIEGFNQGLAFFSRQVGQASRGGGDLYNIFKANGVAIRDTNGQVRSQNDLLLDFANLVKNAGSEQERATLIQRGMGRGAEELGTLFKDGAEGIRTLTDEAKKIGAIISDEDLQKAHDLDDAFDRLASVTMSKLKGVIIDVTAEWYDFWNAVTGQDARRSTENIEKDIRALQKIQEIASHPTPLGQFTKGFTNEGADTAARIQELQDELKRRAIVSLKQQLNSISSKTTPTKLPPATDAKAELNDFERATQAITERTQAVDLETASLGKSNYEAERQKAILDLTQAALRAHLELTPQLKDQIDQLATAYAASTAQYEKSAATFQRVQEASQAAYDATESAFEELITGAKSFNDVLKDLLLSLAKIAAKNWFEKLFMPSQGGASGGIFGSLFSSIGKVLGFADGGVMTPTGPRKLKRFAGGGTSNQAAIFGEAGPEAAVPLPDGRSIPVKFRNTKAKTGGRTGGTTQINQVNNNDFRGADARAIAAISAKVDRVSATVEQRAVAAIIAARKSNPALLR